MGTKLVTLFMPGITRGLTVWLSNGTNKMYMAMACYYDDNTKMPFMNEMISDPDRERRDSLYHSRNEARKVESAIEASSELSKEKKSKRAL